MCDFRLRVCLYLKTVFSVFCAVFRQLVAMEKSFGAGSSVPLCVSISGPASCLLPFSRWRGRRAPCGGQTLSLQALELHLDSFWDQSFFSLFIDSGALY